MLNRVICGNDILAHAKSLAIKALYIKWKPLSQLKRLTLTDFLESDDKVSSNFLGILHTGATTAPSFLTEPSTARHWGQDLSKSSRSQRPRRRVRDGDDRILAVEPEPTATGALDAGQVPLSSSSNSLTMIVSAALRLALRFIDQIRGGRPVSSTTMSAIASGERAIPASPDRASATHRRFTAQRVREARDRLTSTTGTRPAFDYELLRLFAQNRLSASLAVLILVAVIGFLSGVWTSAIRASIWAAAVMVVHAIIITMCRWFLAEAPADLALRAWRTRFILLDLFFGMAWMMSVVHLVGAEESGTTFMLFVMLLVVAMSSMLASSVPLAVFAASAPVTTAVALNFLLRGNMHSYILAALAMTAQCYFAMLAYRLFSTTLATLEARAEKDALIGELEQAKAKSDEARRHAESANVAKSRFLAQMSHELRTPLNAILGFSEVMKSEVFGSHAVPVYREYAGDIHSSGVHLLNLINEILDLSRIEAGRYELNEEPLALAHIVDDCNHLLKLRAKTRGITVHEVFEPDLPRLWADERAVRQICLNLLSNAIKFTPQGGEVWLKVGWTAAGGQYMSVADNGPGIPDDEISIVLASFGQGTNAIKSAEQGTGLGLPIAKNLVDLHGGTFTLKSKLREGTEVIVTFPPERVMSALGPLVERGPSIQPEDDSAAGKKPTAAPALAAKVG